MSSETTTTETLPTIFFPHGGGPWPLMDRPLGGDEGLAELAGYLRGINVALPRPPRAVLIISAHWEAPVATVMTAAQPPMLYDYYGFPKETYEFVWPAPGAPEIAANVRERLEAAGFTTAVDPERGFDHGTFVPLMLADPAASIPTFQLSLLRGLDPAKHLALGRALAPLREQGVLIAGSGMSYHNLPRFQAAFRDPSVGEQVARESRVFDEWLVESVLAEPDTRHGRLLEWERAPAARACHPREEHLLPLMVVAGAGGDAAATLPYRGAVLGASVSAVHFG
ncbi:LigB family dioxygenase [Enhygromyxa salina]|uniref:LigB family dioxygenase n=2 Tax=Enhygromyxa salina TaxID=215803 RepID=A0A2S9YWR4_9BACT|nr:LigB family dioxygenase [Enhygromyxa salina]